MTQKQTTFLKWGILFMGLVLFLFTVIHDRFETSMVIVFSTLLSWLAMSYLLDEFKDFKQIGNTLIASGAIIGLVLFFNFGIEKTAIPRGGFVFNPDGVWKALSMVFLFFVAGILFHYLKDILPEQDEPIAEPEPDDPLLGSDWECVSPEEMDSGKYELAED